LAGGLEDKRSRKAPGRSQGARGRREMGNGNHVCKAASCSEAGGKADRVCRGKQQRVERVKGGQVRSRPSHILSEEGQT